MKTVFKIFAVIAGIYLLYIVAIWVVNIGLAVLLLNNGNSAFLDFAKEKAPRELLGDRQLSLYFRHGYKENGDPVKTFSLEYNRGNSTVNQITENKIIDKYSSLIERKNNAVMTGYGLDTAGKINYFQGKISNSMGDRLEWVTDKNNYGNLRLFKPNGKVHDLLFPGKYHLSFLKDAVVSDIVSVSFITDGLLLVELRNNLQLMKLLSKCEKETPFYKKIAIISTCHKDNIYNDQLPNYPFDSTLFDYQFEKFYPECREGGCAHYSQFDSIILMDINTSNWAEITLGNNPLSY